MYRDLENKIATVGSMPKINLEAAARLKRCREDAGYETATDFINAKGVPEPTYRSHENGNRNISIRAAKQYAKLLGTTYTWILDGEGAAKDSFHEEGINQTDVAILYTLKTIIHFLVKEKMIDKKDLEKAFSNAVDLYQAHHLPEAVKIMSGLHTAVSGGANPTSTEALHKLLDIIPLGSA